MRFVKVMQALHRALAWRRPEAEEDLLPAADVETVPATEAAPTTIVCKVCQEEFILSLGEQQFFAQHALQMPATCRLCRQWLKLPRATRGPRPGARDIAACKVCGAPFELTEATRRWFSSRGMSWPVRCRPCRRRLAATDGQHAEEIHALVDALEGRFAELILTGDPLAEVVTQALAVGKIGQLRATQAAVDRVAL